MTPRNLLVVMDDEHNRKVLGCYGHPVVRTDRAGIADRQRIVLRRRRDHPPGIEHGQPQCRGKLIFIRQRCHVGHSADAHGPPARRAVDFPREPRAAGESTRGVPYTPRDLNPEPTD